MSETTKKACGCCSPTGGADDAAASCDVTDGGQQTRITVKGGYSPARVTVARGVATQLVFDRQESSRCSEELVIPAFGVHAKLLQNQETTIKFTPTEPGIYAFTCGMQMLRGEIVVS